jgi:hypothetical protein
MSWMVWPGLHYDWAVVLRPWKVTLLAWDKSFALTCLVYGLAGILWGWVAARGWDRHREERRAGQAGEAGAHG